jgi:hypothetical protein
MSTQTINVFVSYSHADASLVAPVVRLLRVNKSLVFQDTDGISPGKRWREEIAKALAESNLVVVFWCHHAFRSNEVSTEWRAAIEQGKEVLPLLLDATPLPSDLGNFQWIDFRGTVGANHEPADVGSPAHSRPSNAALRAVWYTLAGVTVVAAAAAAFNLDFFWLGNAKHASPSPGVLPPDASYVDSIGSILLLLGIVGILGAVLLWLWYQLHNGHMRRARARQIAVELEAEIFRRTA